MCQDLQKKVGIAIANLNLVRVGGVFFLGLIGIRALGFFDLYFTELWKLISNKGGEEPGSFFTTQAPIWPFCLVLVVFACIYGIVRISSTD